MGRGQPTGRIPNYITDLEVLLQAKNEKIAELEATIKQARELANNNHELLHLSVDEVCDRFLEALEQDDGN